MIKKTLLEDILEKRAIDEDMDDIFGEDPYDDGEAALMIFEFLGAPIAKARPRVTRAGITFTPKKTRDYEQSLAYAAGIKMGGKEPFDVPLKINIRFFFPIPKSFNKSKHKLAADKVLLPAKKPDIDNLIKAILDALNGIVWVDDALVCAVVAGKSYSENPRVFLKVEPIGGEQ